MDYPQRCQFFAHKFVRLLTKSCAAQDIGLNSFALLCVVVHQEDSARYSGPVRFWNEQLMNVLGFKSPKQLNECRKKAIQFGWLIYERSGNREVGRYAVSIPEQFEGLDDSQIEDNRSIIHSDIHSDSGMNRERIPERLGDESRNESGTESGKPSIPIPIPNPKEQESNEKPKRRCTSSEDQTFTEFWKTYPRRTMKGRARKAWSKALVKVDSETILVAADRYAKQQRGKDQQFIPHPASWLNGEGWEDETLKPKDPFWYLTLPPDEREAFIRAEMAKP